MMPTMEQRVRLVVHAAWDMRDQGLSNEKIVDGLEAQGVPRELAEGIPALVEEAARDARHDEKARAGHVQSVVAAVEAEDFDGLPPAIAGAVEDDRTLQKVYEKLAELLVDDSHEKGTVAAFGLSLLVGMGDWPLIQALEHKDSNVRYRAAFALGKMGAAAKNALPTLQKLKTDPDEYVRSAATEAIGRIKPWWKFW